jgi:hypothetical protein
MNTLLIWLLVVIVFVLIIYKRFYSSNKRASDNIPEGVGGWLLFLIVGLTIGPLINASILNGGILFVERQHPNIKTQELWITLKYVTWCVVLLFSVLSWYAALGLAISRTMTVIHRTKILLWVIGPFAYFVIHSIIPMFILGRVLSNPSAIVASFLGAILWTLYLSKSKRVLATYGSSQEMVKSDIQKQENKTDTIVNLG